ncbi:MAG TPA: ATP-binding cassette domain-containing protein, partial [Oscillospiraceae bacterium]|nr:ATP-binding cassette domain-containing protein [Oscillospiraceae bacterium]
DQSLLEWIAPYAKESSEIYIRGFLGRMLFSGDEALKPVKVLSGGERVRSMLARMMMLGSNVLLMDQPTNHLDLEAITALNNGLIDFKGVVIFSTQDYQFAQTVANRVIEITPEGLIDKVGPFEDYVEYKKANAYL